MGFDVILDSEQFYIQKRVISFFYDYYHKTNRVNAIIIKILSKLKLQPKRAIPGRCSTSSARYAMKAASGMSLFFIFLRGYFQADKPNANIWLQIYPQSKYKTESMQVLSSLLVKLIFGSWKYRIYCCI